uniref:Uncharacterized protein n=1 Tax=Arundo donax TaxID=35708 RepID=A0A0A9GK55_ARUDO
MLQCSYSLAYIKKGMVNDANHNSNCQRRDCYMVISLDTIIEVSSMEQ